MYVGSAVNGDGHVGHSVNQESTPVEVVEDWACGVMFMDIRDGAHRQHAREPRQQLFAVWCHEFESDEHKSCDAERRYKLIVAWQRLNLLFFRFSDCRSNNQA